MFKCLDNHKKNASILFANIKFDELPIDAYIKLFNEYYDIFDFDVIPVTSTIKMIIESLNDNNQSKEKLSVKIEEMSNSLDSQKVQINELMHLINEQKELINSLTNIITTQNDKINSLSTLITSQRDQFSNEFITKQQMRTALEQGRSYADNEQIKNHQNWNNEGRSWPSAEHWATWGKAYIAAATSLQKVKESIPF